MTTYFSIIFVKVCEKSERFRLYMDSLKTIPQNICLNPHKLHIAIFGSKMSGVQIPSLRPPKLVDIYGVNENTSEKARQLMNEQLEKFNQSNEHPDE